MKFSKRHDDLLDSILGGLVILIILAIALGGVVQFIGQTALWWNVIKSLW